MREDQHQKRMPGKFIVAQRTAEQIEDVRDRCVQVLLLGLVKSLRLSAKEQPDDRIIGDAREAIVRIVHDSRFRVRTVSDFTQCGVGSEGEGRGGREEGRRQERQDCGDCGRAVGRCRRRTCWRRRLFRAILTPLIDSVADYPHLSHASSLCGACQTACPVKINIPHMLIGLRELQHHEPKKGRFLEKLAYRLAREVLSRPWLYKLVLRAARFVLRFRARGGWLRSMPGAGAGWTGVRDFPAPAPRSFREQWHDLNSAYSTTDR